MHAATLSVYPPLLSQFTSGYFQFTSFTPSFIYPANPITLNPPSSPSSTPTCYLSTDQWYPIDSIIRHRNRVRKHRFVDLSRLHPPYEWLTYDLWIGLLHWSFPCTQCVQSTSRLLQCHQNHRNLQSDRQIWLHEKTFVLFQFEFGVVNNIVVRTPLCW